MAQVLKSSTNWPARLWPWLVAEGVIGVVAGLLAVTYPGVTVLALALLLGFGLLIQGLFEVLAVARRLQGSRRWWMTAFGALSILAGLICLIHPGAGVFALILGLSVWFMITGINDVIRAIEGAENRLWNATIGTLTFIAAILLIVQPGLAVTTVALIAGFAFMVRGALDIGLGLTLRRSRTAR